MVRNMRPVGVAVFTPKGDLTWTSRCYGWQAAR